LQNFLYSLNGRFSVDIFPFLFDFHIVNIPSDRSCSSIGFLGDAMVDLGVEPVFKAFREISV